MSGSGPYVYEYPRPRVSVDAVVFSGSRAAPQVLLVKRGIEPFLGAWATPGGFIEIEEPLEDAAARELEEETGLRGVALEQLRAFGDPGRDPRGRSITIAYWGRIDGTPPAVRAGDDAAEAAWFPIDALPRMAFDHRMIVDYAVARLNGAAHP